MAFTASIFDEAGKLKIFSANPNGGMRWITVPMSLPTLTQTARLPPHRLYDGSCNSREVSSAGIHAASSASRAGTARPPDAHGPSCSCATTKSTQARRFAPIQAASTLTHCGRLTGSLFVESEAIGTDRTETKTIAEEHCNSEPTQLTQRFPFHREGLNVRHRE